MVFRALLSLGWWQEVRQVPYIKGKKELVLVGCDKKKKKTELSFTVSESVDWFNFGGKQYRFFSENLE